MTRLLVSVRSLDEALLAAKAGVDLIDLKEPSRGPLGMADVEVRHAIGQRLGEQHRLSAAGGELRDWLPDNADNSNFTFEHGAGAWASYRFAKIGLAGCADDAQWQDKWLAWRSRLPSFSSPVLVCYADAERCGAPSYPELRRFAARIGIRTMLFDTFQKHEAGLCQLWKPADFLRITQELRADGISFVLAGKIELADVPHLAQYNPAYLGVRGAVCDPTVNIDDRRCGILSSAKIKSWQQALRIPSPDTMRTV